MNGVSFGQILLCRPPRSITGQEETHEWGSSAKASASANEVTRVMEDILSASVARLCQVHTYGLYRRCVINALTSHRVPALFNALAMHVYAMCTSPPIGREVSENRAHMCMLGLASLQDSWPLSAWVFHLFKSIMDKLKNRVQEPRPVHVPRPRSTSDDLPMQIPRDEERNSSDDNVVIPPFTSDDQQTSSAAWTNENMIPNMFVFDDPRQDHLSSQNGFFDSLNIPTWPETSNTLSLNQR